MPIYEYRCQACEAELEKLQKISDPPLVECPECGRESLVKLVSAASFRLKGGGWYESDFKTGKKKNGLAEADSSAAGTSENGKGSESTAADAGKGSNGGTDKAAAKQEKAGSVSVSAT